MRRAWMVLGLVLLSPVAAHAQGYRISRAPDPAPDDPLREEKLKDRATIAELNRAEAKRTAERDRRALRQRDDANARARARYEAQMADWRRRVAACSAGDWSQCDR